MATQQDNKLVDSLPDLLAAYEALALLAHSEEGPSSPLVPVLHVLNLCFRGVVDSLDARGMLS